MHTVEDFPSRYLPGGTNHKCKAPVYLYQHPLKGPRVCCYKVLVNKVKYQAPDGEWKEFQPFLCENRMLTDEEMALYEVMAM